MKTSSTLTAFAAFTFFVSALIMSPPSSATLPAGFTCVSDGRGGTVCTVSASAGGSDGGAHETSGSGSSASKMSCTYLGQEIDCTSSNGTWSQARSCWVRPVTAEDVGQGPYDIAMGEHKDGVVMACTIPGARVLVQEGDGISYTSLFWAESAPTNIVDPATVAQTAIASMNLHMGTLASNPPESSNPEIMGLVGYPVWLWISDPSESTTGPITTSASQGGVSVTATATLDHITWNMGDGGQTICYGPGTPGQVIQNAEESPTCGYTYQHTSADQPNLTYTVTATSHWNITWSGGGQSGSQTLTFTDSTHLRIGEAQVLITSQGN